MVYENTQITVIPIIVDLSQVILLANETTGRGSDSFITGFPYFGSMMSNKSIIAR